MKQATILNIIVLAEHEQREWWRDFTLDSIIQKPCYSWSSWSDASQVEHIIWKSVIFNQEICFTGKTKAIPCFRSNPVSPIIVILSCIVLINNLGGEGWMNFYITTSILSPSILHLIPFCSLKDPFQEKWKQSEILYLLTKERQTSVTISKKKGKH